MLWSVIQMQDLPEHTKSQFNHRNTVLEAVYELDF